MNTPATTVLLVWAGLYMFLALGAAFFHDTSMLLCDCLVSGVFLEAARQANRFGL